MNQTIKLNINDALDRDNMICALAGAGYKVWVEEHKVNYERTSWVCFEYPVTEPPPPDLSDEIVNEAMRNIYDNSAIEPEGEK